MLLHFGERNYGVIDEVPGVLYVATRMMHIWFFPLIPLEGQIVVEPEIFGSDRSVGTRLQRRSVFFAYVRSLLVVSAVLFTLLALSEPWLGALGLVCVAVWGWTRGIVCATFDRAIELAEAVGVSRTIIVHNFQSRGLATSTAPSIRGEECSRLGQEPPKKLVEETNDVFRLE